jgi:hypothetical protein
VTFKVGSNTELVKIYSNPITLKDLEKKVVPAKIVDKLQFELSDMLGVGLLTVFTNDIITAGINFSVEFSQELVKILQLAQAKFSGDITATKRKVLIKLRAEAPKSWPDLRKELLFYYKWTAGSGAGELKLFEKRNQPLSYYMGVGFFEFPNGKSVYVYDPQQHSYKLHAELAKLFGLPKHLDA